VDPAICLATNLVARLPRLPVVYAPTATAAQPACRRLQTVTCAGVHT
jgi:hypothetical protein